MRELNVSRAIPRAGIGYLAALGVMKIKHGVGTFVADGPPDFGLESLSFIGALHGFRSWQMFEARILLENSLAALAAERGMEEHHAALTEEVAEMLAAVERPAEFLVHDVLFHPAKEQCRSRAATFEAAHSAAGATRLWRVG